MKALFFCSNEHFQDKTWAQPIELSLVLSNI